MSDHWHHAFETALTQTLVTGETLFRRNDAVGSAYLVRTGRILLRRALKDGGLLTLCVASKGDLVAEASLFADRYHCDAVTDVETTVASLPRQEMLARLGSRLSEDHLALKALESTAHEVQTLRTRIEVLRLRRVADRLDAYLELYGLPDTGEWVRLADWIGVTPPALYRNSRDAGKDNHLRQDGLSQTPGQS